MLFFVHVLLAVDSYRVISAKALLSTDKASRFASVSDSCILGR